VVEATSGNTGIGLAMVCTQKGYPLVVTMAENFSVERRKLMRFLGAKVILTPASEKGSGMLAKAVELAQLMAGSSAANSRTKPTRTSIPKPLPSKYWRLSRETGSTIGSPGWAPAGRSRALRAC
jgi:hypothetical protein